MVDKVAFDELKARRLKDTTQVVRKPRRRRRVSDTRNRLTIITAWAAIASSMFAGVSSIFAGMQWYETHSGSSMLQEQSRALSQSARSSEQQVRLASNLVEAYRAQISVLKDQLEGTNNQIALQERAVRSAHQIALIDLQKLEEDRVERAHQLRSMTITAGLLTLKTIDRGYASIQLTNSGSSPITITRKFVALAVDINPLKRPPNVKPEQLENQLMSSPVTNETLDPRNTREVLTEEVVHIPASIVARMETSSLFLILKGGVEYLDVTGHSHRQYICQYRHVTKYFGEVQEQCAVPLTS